MLWGKNILFILLLVAIISCKPSANKFTGSWIGTAETTPFPELILMHCDTGLSVKMYYTGIELQPTSQFSFENTKIRFALDQPNFKGSFEGTLDGDTIKGLLSNEKGAFPCNFVKIIPEGPETVSEFEGFYQLGDQHILQLTPFALDFSLSPLSITDFKTGKKRIAFPKGDNLYIAGNRMLSPFPTDFSLSCIKAENDVLKIKLKEGNNTLEGERLAHLDKVVFLTTQNKEVTIKASLHLPATTGKSPLVVVVHGAGNQSRDNYNLQDFVALLPYYGIATLIYDKRGCGESTGDQQQANFNDLAEDLEAIITEAAKNPEIDASKIGLVGIDQAGYIMPLIANKNNQIQFVVGISTTALSMQEQELNACAMRMKSDGFQKDDIEAALTYQKKMFAYLDKKIDSVTFQQASDQMLSKPWKDYVTSFEKKEWIAWWRKNYNFNPQEALSKLTVPTFMLYGGKDPLTNPENNLAVLKDLLKGEQHKSKVYPEANHFMYIAGDRGDFQLTEIEGYPEGMFNEINEWIGEKFGLL
ncbi:MAG: alpha/beta hydrolase [Bacteroidota bacterium]